MSSYLSKFNLTFAIGCFLIPKSRVFAGFRCAVSFSVLVGGFCRVRPFTAEVIKLVAPGRPGRSDPLSIHLLKMNRIRWLSSRLGQEDIERFQGRSYTDGLRNVKSCADPSR